MTKLLATSVAVAALIAGSAGAATFEATNNPVTGQADAPFNTQNGGGLPVFTFDPIFATPGFLIHDAVLEIELTWTATGTINGGNDSGTGIVTTLLDFDIQNSDFASLSGTLGAAPTDGGAEFETAGTQVVGNVPANTDVAVDYSINPDPTTAQFSLNDNLGLLSTGLSFSAQTLTLTTAGIVGGGSIDADVDTIVTADARIITTEKLITAVPVPAALPLLLSAIGGLGFLGWRSRRA